MTVTKNSVLMWRVPAEERQLRVTSLPEVSATPSTHTEYDNSMTNLSFCTARKKNYTAQTVDGWSVVILHQRFNGNTINFLLEALAY